MRSSGVNVVIAILFVCMLISGSALSAISVVEENFGSDETKTLEASKITAELSVSESVEKTTAITNRTPIRINNDTEFTSANGVSAGDGSAGNPYIIENWDINGSGFGHCIYIGNTSKYFVLRNCYLHDSIGGGGNYYWDSGLLLFNVTSGTILNTTCSNNDFFGTILYGSSNNTIINCSFINNDWNLLWYNNNPVPVPFPSNNNTFDNCRFLSQGTQGITIESSGNNLFNNSIFRDNMDGIELSGAYYNCFTNNSVIENANHGFYIHYSFSSSFIAHNNTITNNNIFKNSNYGAILENANDNWIHHNNFVDNNGGGVQGDDNTGTNNWDDGIGEGNFWSDYLNRYPSASSNGVFWKPAYNISGAGDDIDQYPLYRGIGLKYSPRPPIRIDSDADFTNASGVSWGDGTAGDPYIIEGWGINGSGYGACIYIGNTSKYYIVRDCYTHRASGNSGRYYQNAGISLDQAPNGIVMNNRCPLNEEGICCWDSDNVEMVNNTLNFNTQFGLGIYSSFSPEIIENNCSKNGVDGIFITIGSNLARIVNNSCYDNARDGISLNSCSFLELYNNKLYNCGIYFDGSSSHYSTMELPTNNTVNAKPIYFYKDTDLNNASIPSGAGEVILGNVINAKIENLVFNNSSIGIITGFCSNIQIANNSFNSLIRNGIDIHNSNNITVINNSFIDSRVVGLFLDDSSDITITKNIFNDNDDGIRPYRSDNNIIDKNTFYNNNIGIDFIQSDRNQIIENSFLDNNNGVFVFESERNTVKNNTFFRNLYGMSFYDSIKNDVFYNILRVNSNYGVFIDSTSSNNTIHHNDFINNNGGGAQGFDDNGTNFWNDTFGEGNYWDDYLKRYPSATTDGHVWSPPYNISGAGDNVDYYPLSRSVISALSIFNPIRIDDDSEFNATNGVTSGTGSINNPYIIDNWNISGSGYGFCIYIGNTTKYFNIRNCSLRFAKGNNGQYYWDSGIALSNLTNGKIENNTIYSNAGKGIYIEDSMYCTIINNMNISKNTQEGIYTSNCSYSSITNNNVSWNNQGGTPWFYAGIQLEDSHNNIIDWNYVSNNPERGLRLYKSKANDLMYNQLVFNCGGNTGLNLDNSDFNNIIFNNISKNTGEGVEMYYSYNNTFINNTINKNNNPGGSGGVYSYDSDNCTWINNTFIANNQDGIYFSNSDNHYFMNNNFSDNGDYGAEMTESNGHEFINNIFYNNTNDGLRIDGMLGSSDNIVTNNTFWSNGDDGIEIISLGPSPNNRILSNLFINNSAYGIRISLGPTDNIIHHNNFIDNNGGGVQGFDSTGNNYWNDTIGEGNWWSDYEARYVPPAISDGHVWNISYVVDGGVGSNDSYPLAYPVEYDSPVITDFSPITGTTGESYIFSCNVTDNMNVSVVYVKYWYGSNFAGAVNVTMTYNSGNDRWQHQISLPGGSLELLNYNISTEDPSHNWASVVDKSVTILDNDRPTARAGSSININMTQKINLNGGSSSDNIGIVNYTWHFVYGGNDVYRYTSNFDFKFDIAGNYLVDLKVTDVAGLNDTDSIWVNVSDVFKPEILDVSYPASVNIGQGMGITVSVMDPSGIDSVKLNYTDVNSAFHEVAMTHQTGTDWGYTIPGQPIDGQVAFHIIVDDIYLNSNKSVTYYIDILDNILPRIKGIAYSKKVDVGNSFNITAEVEDNSGISKVKLNYTDVNGTHYNVTMTAARGVNYTYTIPAQAKKGTINFFVWVEDTSGNWNKSVVHQIEITSIAEVKKPEITWVTIPDKATVGDPITIIVKVTDAIGVDKVYLNYTDVWGKVNNVTMTLQSGDYTYNIPAQNKTGSIKLHVFAINTQAVSNKTGVRTIEIEEKPKDTEPPKVTATDPANNAIDIPINTKVKITFSESMKTTGIELAISFNNPTNYTLTWTGNDSVLTISFVSDLNYNTTYEITLGTAFQDLVGNKLKEAYTFRFTTVKKTPEKVDTDGDKLPDDWETKHGLDPNDASDANKDSDDDGLTNLEEYEHNTDPKDKDSDNDKIPDGWEVKYGLDPNDPTDAKEDPDDDGFTNLEEYDGDSDPTDSSSVPEEKEGDNMLLIAAIIIIIIIIILIMVLLMRRKKTVPEAEEEEPGEDEEELEDEDVEDDEDADEEELEDEKLEELDELEEGAMEEEAEDIDEDELEEGELEEEPEVEEDLELDEDELKEDSDLEEPEEELTEELEEDLEPELEPEPDQEEEATEEPVVEPEEKPAPEPKKHQLKGKMPVRKPMKLKRKPMKLKKK